MSGAIAATNWAVTRGILQPFGAWPRFVRRVSDPMLRPIERRLLGAGGNPQHAPFWLLALVVFGGLGLIALTRWLVGAGLSLSYVGQAGPGALLRLAVDWTFKLLIGALLVRVIASWFGMGEFSSRWIRPVYALTNWLVNPIRRVMPNMGMIDLSPMVAYLVLLALQWAVQSLLP